MDETLSWLQTTVELPQYADKFRANEVTGSKLPQVDNFKDFKSNFDVSIQTFLDCNGIKLSNKSIGHLESNSSVQNLT